jgi:small subunit ribosomal protein S1
MSEEKNKEIEKKSINNLKDKNTEDKKELNKKKVKSSSKSSESKEKDLKSLKEGEKKVLKQKSKQVKKLKSIDPEIKDPSKENNLSKDENITNNELVLDAHLANKEAIEEASSDSKKTKSNLEEFDWEKAVKNDMYTSKERSDFENKYAATLTEVIDKQVLDGTVVTITDREVVVDINFKSDGIISFNEFKYNPDLKVGDLVEVLVEKQEDKNGQLVLSHRRARVLRAWEKVNIALETGEVVNGQISSRTKGGMIVDVFGIECFFTWVPD